MAINEFKAFATGENANVIAQNEYEELEALTEGFQSGIARSEQLNKVWRQATTGVAALAQFISDSADTDILDNGNSDEFLAKLILALESKSLSRKNPFGDIAADGDAAINQAQVNLRLGEAAKMPAATAIANISGNIVFPVLIGGIQRTVLLQWKRVSVPQSGDGNMVVVEDSWPIAFPNSCLSINPGLTNSLIYATSGTPFVSAAIVDRVMFKAACAYTKSNSTVTVWGVGY